MFRQDNDIGTIHAHNSIAKKIDATSASCSAVTPSIAFGISVTIC